MTCDFFLKNQENKVTMQLQFNLHCPFCKEFCCMFLYTLVLRYSEKNETFPYNFRKDISRWTLGKTIRIFYNSELLSNLIFTNERTFKKTPCFQLVFYSFIFFVFSSSLRIVHQIESKNLSWSWRIVGN